VNLLIKSDYFIGNLHLSQLTHISIIIIHFFVGAGEERDFRLVWPRSFVGEVATTDMLLDVDMFGADTFTKQYFSGGRYQSLQPGE
jgi:hypothetical protein